MDKRARLLETAARLFNREGFHAVGIDRILAEAGVAKMTLYKHFPSKDGLVLAVLERKRTAVLDWHAQAGGVEGIFDRLGDWFADEDFHGCLFARAAQEYPDLAHPARKAAATYTRKLRQLLSLLCEDEIKAEELLLLIEGAAAVAAKTGAGRLAAERARTAARALTRP
jgi:AcrR family transcriptional regulator